MAVLGVKGMMFGAFLAIDLVVGCWCGRGVGCGGGRVVGAVVRR